MIKTEPNQGAFASMSQWNKQIGLTKREYFAAMAMQGLLSRAPNRHGGEIDLGILEAQRIVEESKIMANFLIEELNKETNDKG